MSNQNTELNERVEYTKRNATDKWNGFSYQGKVGLLLALLRLREHLELADDQLNKWHVDFEVSEDVSIYSGETVISKHQVKAYSSSSSHLYSAYTTAITAFEISNTPEDGRFLHTASEVTDFKDDNDQKVQLYVYPDGNKYCRLADDKIFAFCVAAIQSIRDGIDDELARNIGYYLMHQIARIINDSHDSLKGNGTIKPARVNLLVLRSWILHSSMDSIADTLEESRLKNSLTETWDDFREFKGSNELNAGQADRVTAILNKITCLKYDDVLDFLEFIHPDVNFNKLGRNISISGFKDVFLNTLLACTPEYDSDGGVYKINDSYYIPTTISRPASPMTNKEVAQGIITNHNPNAKRLLFEKSSIINSSIDGDLFELAEHSNRKYSSNEAGLEHVMAYAGSRLIKLDDAIEKINQEPEGDVDA